MGGIILEPNKPMDESKETTESFTPGQQAFLGFLQWGAWTTAFVALLYVMHS